VHLSECPYVVVDCETTGFHPSAHHRVIELALVTVDGSGSQSDVWCSLLNPGRDLGPTDVHGIRGRDLEDAPTFKDVLGDVVERIAGRVVIAHNARFDCAFLEHELALAGVQVAPLSALCTMQVAGLFGLAGTRARLADCCAAIGYAYRDAHTAEADALACAALFAALLSALRERAIDDLSALGCGDPLPFDSWPHDARRAQCKRRAARFGERKEPSFLGKLVQDAETPPGADAMQVAPYLDVLDRALEDRRLSREEQEDLAATAAMLGLSRSRLSNLHADYVGTLITLAYRDGAVTSREREDLDLVAEALGVAGVDEALRHVKPGRLDSGGTGGVALAGKSVCFTGALSCEYAGAPITREIAEELATQAGMVVAPRVTRDVDVLVVADPHSLSGKARKAREYGTRIIAETAFWPMIDVDVT
jgi:DNA polymerase-3 subunit epsilon